MLALSVRLGIEVIVMRGYLCARIGIMNAGRVVSHSYLARQGRRNKCCQAGCCDGLDCFGEVVVRGEGGL